MLIRPHEIVETVVSLLKRTGGGLQPAEIAHITGIHLGIVTNLIRLLRRRGIIRPRKDDLYEFVYYCVVTKRGMAMSLDEIIEAITPRPEGASDDD